MEGKYYNITFHLLDNHVFTKKEIYSEKEPFECWQDACVSITEEVLHIFSDNQYTILNRSFILRIDVQEVLNPLDKKERNQGNLTKVVDTLNNFGL